TYSVVAPRVLRPNRDFTVVVSTHGTKELVRATVEVGGRQDAGGVILNRQVAELESDSTQTLKFEIGELGSGEYNLTVTGYGGLSFYNTTRLNYEGKSYSVFIETDRGTYKPGDVIKFRAIVVNPLLKPSVTGAIDVYITVSVFSGEIPLSEEPVLGQWNITVDVLGQKTVASVLVAEYVLPKFEVEVDLPKYATFDDREIVATVKARYTYGQPVKGEVTIQVSPTYKYAYLQAPYDKPVSVVKMMKGKTDIVFNMFTDLRLKEDYIRELQFTAYVKEELTDRVQNATSTITVFKYPYSMEFIRTSDSFKPGLKYTAFLKLSYHDDTPVRSGEVTIRHAFSRDQSKFVESIHRVPSNGIVPLTFFPPLDENVLNLALEAQYGNLTQWLADITRAQSPSNSFLQATLLTENPKVGEEVEVELNATQPMLHFVYEILGRGDVIYAQTLQAHKGTTHVFRFVATPSMAPRARLVVYYVREDGEIVADSLHFALEGAIQNEDGILQELESYDPGRIDAPSPWHYLQNRRKRSLFSYHGTTTTSDVFKNAGIVVLTNGIVYDFNPYAYYRILHDGPDLRHMESKVAPTSVSAAPHMGTIQTRTRFLETWLFSIADSGRFVLFYTFDLNNGIVDDDSNPHIPDFEDEYKYLSFYYLSVSGAIPVGYGPIDGSRLEPERMPAAVNGPFGRAFAPLDSSTLKPDLGPGVVYNSPTRPPLAGPYAFSFLPPPPDDKPRIYLNKALPKPWIFRDAATRFNGVVSIREKAPDSITSYILSAFAIDDFYGLGVSNTPAKVTIFRPFFVSVHLPSSVIRGEAAAVEIVVFNYGKTNVTANVTLFNPGPGDFLFPDFANEIDQGSPASFHSKTVNVPAEDGAPLSFMVVPQKLGYIDIRVSANSPTAVDVVSKKLLVKPEGSKLTVNRALLVDLRSEQSFSETVNITTPRNIVDGSLDISVSVMGDILGGAVNDLDSLIQLPTGCGEQNMAKMVPNIVLVEIRINLASAYLERARRNLELGYQRQLTFRHENGSFSAFGKRDDSGSTWLTAFVIQSFMMAKRHIDIEDSVISKATEWLREMQEKDGSFREKGEVVNDDIQGGATEGVPLTAFVTIALIQMQNLGVQGVRNTINRALEYLVGQLEVMDDPYSLAISTYALQLANNPYKDTAFFKLEAKAVVEDDKKWWERSPLHKTIETNVNSKPLDIETTSYALLTYSIRGLVRDALPILKWLTAQRNQNGGFQSTQDTSIGMQALASMAKLMSNANPRLEVQIISGSRGEKVSVNNVNAMMLQKKEITNDTESVMIKARGSGFAIVQVTYSFNVYVTGPGPSFSLDPQLDPDTDSNKLKLTTCTGYTNGNSSNMAVLDVSLPSGYVIDNDLIPSLYNYDRVKRVEKKENGAGVLLYFDSLTPQEVCPSISAYRVSKVAFQKRAPVRVYDYYDTSRQARQFYEPAPATLCDICDLDECDPTRCEKQIVELNRQLQDPADFYYPGIVEEQSGCGRITPLVSLLFIIIGGIISKSLL
ncbi:Antigen, partial [Armadillidium nasatum]